VKFTEEVMDGKTDGFRPKSSNRSAEKEIKSVSIAVATHQARANKNEANSELNVLSVRTSPQVVVSQADLPSQSPPGALQERSVANGNLLALRFCGRM
jgi:hypothetical protein